MKKLYFFKLLLIFFLNWNFSQAQITLNDSLKSKLDSIFSTYESTKKPGGAIGIISDGKMIYERYFGMEDVKKSIPISASTTFNLASVAKQFTGMCIALLEEQEKLNLSDNINQYFPQFKFPGTITIKNLLDHSSGIREATVLGILSGHVNLYGDLPNKYYNEEFLFSVLAKERDLNFPTGTESAYTNINYVLLADIVEQVSGMTFKAFADSAIFKPLKMTNTYVEDFSSKVSLMGYNKRNKGFKKRIQKAGLVGEDNVISTLNDLYLWNENFYNNQLGNKDQNLINKITTSTILNNGKKSNYAYGLDISEYKGMKVVEHDGESDIHTSFIIRLPEQKLSIICLTNTTDYINPILQSYKILDLFFGDETLDLNNDEEHSFISITPEQIKDKAGTYFHLMDNGTARFREVSIEKNQLTISYSLKGKQFPLDAFSTNKFIRYSTAGYPVRLIFNKENGGYSFIERFNEGPWKREDWKFQQFEKQEVNNQDFTGTYIDKHHGVKIKVSVKNKRLVVKKSIIRIPTLRLEGNLFYSPEYEASFIFNRNESGDIESLKINASDFRNFKMWRKSP